MPSPLANRLRAANSWRASPKGAKGRVPGITRNKPEWIFHSRWMTRNRRRSRLEGSVGSKAGFSAYSVKFLTALQYWIESQIANTPPSLGARGLPTPLACCSYIPSRGAPPPRGPRALTSLVAAAAGATRRERRSRSHQPNPSRRDEDAGHRFPKTRTPAGAPAPRVAPARARARRTGLSERGAGHGCHARRCGLCPVRRSNLRCEWWTGGER